MSFPCPSARRGRNSAAAALSAVLLLSLALLPTGSATAQSNAATDTACENGAESCRRAVPAADAAQATVPQDDERPPRQNFGALLGDSTYGTDAGCRETGSDGLLRQGHWDSAQGGCVYPEPRAGDVSVPRAKFN